MLVLPEDSPSSFTIIGLDPGTSTLGFAVLTIDISTLKIVSSTATTFVGDKLHSVKAWTRDTHGDRTARIQAHGINLRSLFNTYKPLLVASESPFYSQRRPQAFGALTEVITEIRNAILDVDPWRCLFLVDPPTVKKAVGAPGNAQKEIVKEKLLLLADLNYNGFRPLNELDEHSIDALAVAYCQYKLYLERIWKS